MITIQSGMLIVLGFLAAVLLGLLVAPALWRRAVRLTTHRIKTTIPLSEMEIEADRDRIRAEYAIKMHKLEMLVEQVKLTGARQQIEINRRDARVNMLEADLEALRARHEEAQNARRVLEQTISDRLPRVEERLVEARKVLNAREREITDLNVAAEKQVQALADARVLNDERRHEIDRLSRLVPSGRGRSGGGEAGLQSELRSLQTKTREQAQLIERLQGLSGRKGQSAAATEAGTHSDPDLSARNNELQREAAELRARGEDQAAEIARLKAAIQVFEKNADGDMLGTVKESRLALKARVQSLEAQTLQQTETMARLRSELAAANERIARQAAHFTGELKRLGAGAMTTRESRRSDAARTSLAERVARAAGGATEADSPGHQDTADPTWVADMSAASGGDIPAASEPVQRETPADERSVGQDAPSAIRDDAARTDAIPNDDDRRSQRSTARARSRLLDRIAGLSRTS